MFNFLLLWLAYTYKPAAYLECLTNGKVECNSHIISISEKFITPYTMQAASCSSKHHKYCMLQEQSSHRIYFLNVHATKSDVHSIYSAYSLIYTSFRMFPLPPLFLIILWDEMLSSFQLCGINVSGKIIAYPQLYR